MIFDYIVGNPAFNIAQDNNIAGTGGNTTLYKTSARHDFSNNLKQGGKLILVTLKGIIPDLYTGFFKDYQVDFINLMDMIDIWPYNTCFFSVTKKKRTAIPPIIGGMAAKIYSPNPDDCFPFVYYASSDSGLNGKFSSSGKNKVIRRLPGKTTDDFVYDFTNVEVGAGWKFAFNVLESKKSYSVTNEPVYGGTICYVGLPTEEYANKLRLFVENNPYYREYVKRMKIRGHAFGLRHMKKFDLSQIHTGHELPTEWGLEPNDILTPIVIKSDKVTNEEKAKKFGEVFTPSALVTEILDEIQSNDPHAFKNDTLTYLDSMCGDGQFLGEVLIRKVENGIDFETALSTIYGVDLMQDNVDLCRERLLCGREDLRHIVEKNIVCADGLKYDYSFGEPTQWVEATDLFEVEPS